MIRLIVVNAESVNYPPASDIAVSKNMLMGRMDLAWHWVNGIQYPEHPYKNMCTIGAIYLC